MRGEEPDWSRLAKELNRAGLFCDGERQYWKAAGIRRFWEQYCAPKEEEDKKPSATKAGILRLRVAFPGIRVLRRQEVLDRVALSREQQQSWKQIASDFNEQKLVHELWRRKSPTWTARQLREYVLRNAPQPLAEESAEAPTSAAIAIDGAAYQFGDGSIELRLRLRPEGLV